MLSNVSDTSIDSYHNHSVTEFKDQYDEVEWLILRFWWEHGQWPVNKELAFKFGWETGTIAGRVNHLVTSGRCQLTGESRLPNPKIVGNKKSHKAHVVKVSAARHDILLPKLKKVAA